MDLNRRRVVVGVMSAAMIPLITACQPVAADKEDSKGFPNPEPMPDGSSGAVQISRLKLPEPFTHVFSVPPNLEPVRQDDTSDYYEIVQRKGQAEIIPGILTEIWGYNGVFPGPTILARSGRRVVVTHRNELPVPTVVHLHGGRTEANHDGYPLDYVLPVDGWRPGLCRSGRNEMTGEKDYIYSSQQRAATLWYHDHRMDFTGPQVWRGLAGFHLISDEVDDALPVPKGQYDVPVMICDRAFLADGSLDYPSLDKSLAGVPGIDQSYDEGVLGDAMLVNGRLQPRMDVEPRLYRFRFLNASNARAYRLVLDQDPIEGPAFWQIGSDLGLLASPVQLKRIEIAQAERYDVLIDFSQFAPGARVVLRNAFVDGPMSQIMCFDIADAAPQVGIIPMSLAPVEQIQPAADAIHRTFNFAQGEAEDGTTVWMINGKTFNDGVFARPELGATEVWELTAKPDHPIHIHNAEFQILSRNGQTPVAQEGGFKDTVRMDSNDRVEIAIRFSGYRGLYVFHCHNLEHEDMMMMAQFEVT